DLGLKPRRQWCLDHLTGACRLHSGTTQGSARSRGGAIQAVRRGAPSDRDFPVDTRLGFCFLARLLCAVPDAARASAAIGAVDQLCGISAFDAAQGPAAGSTTHPPRRAPMIISLVLISGMRLAAGMCCLVMAFARTAPRLEPVLERIATDGVDRPSSHDIGPVRSPSERLGAFIYRIVPVPLSSGQRRALRLQDKSIAE